MCYLLFLNTKNKNNCKVLLSAGITPLLLIIYHRDTILYPPLSILFHTTSSVTFAFKLPVTADS